MTSEICNVNESHKHGGRQRGAAGRWAIKREMRLDESIRSLAGIAATKMNSAIHFYLRMNRGWEVRAARLDPSHFSIV